MLCFVELQTKLSPFQHEQATLGSERWKRGSRHGVSDRWKKRGIRHGKLWKGTGKIEATGRCACDVYYSAISISD